MMAPVFATLLWRGFSWRGVRPWVRSGLAGAACALSAQSAIGAPPSSFTYCSSPSISPRGRGLIITRIFSSRSDPKFIANAFARYLSNSYAPYGNGWSFPAEGPACTSFPTRRAAENQRNLETSRVTQPAETIFVVTFELS